jgi:hypothetical protein
LRLARNLTYPRIYLDCRVLDRTLNLVAHDYHVPSGTTGTIDGFQESGFLHFP